MHNTKEAAQPQDIRRKISEAFSRNAASLIPEESIRRTLAEEQRRFENAAALQISPGKFTGQNTERHCKELLRRNQPFFPLYLLISFLMECSLALLIYGAICSCFQYAFIHGMPGSYPVLYALPVIGGFFLYRYISHEIYLRQLARKTDKPALLRRHIKKQHILAEITIIILCTAAETGIVFSGLSHRCRFTLLDTLILYAFCAILAGIHNLIYDSHMPALLSIGWTALQPRRKSHSHENVSGYVSASLEQLIQCGTTKAQAEKQLRSRLLCFQIYAALALIILIPLDILCIYQLLRTFSPALPIFTLISLSGSLLCLIIIISCRTVLKSMK